MTTLQPRRRRLSLVRDVIAVTSSPGPRSRAVQAADVILAYISTMTASSSSLALLLLVSAQLVAGAPPPSVSSSRSRGFSTYGSSRRGSSAATSPTVLSPTVASPTVVSATTSPTVASPTVVCLTRGWSYGSLRRQLIAAFSRPLSALNRNSSFAFRPQLTLSHRVVELSEFSPPEVRNYSTSLRLPVPGLAIHERQT